MQTPLGFEVLDVKPRPPIQMLDNSSSAMMSPRKTEVASLDKADFRQIENLYKAIAAHDQPLVSLVSVTCTHVMYFDVLCTLEMCTPAFHF